jgi:hypothetical protein
MALFRRLGALGGLGVLALVLVALQLPLTATSARAATTVSGTVTTSRGNLGAAGVLGSGGGGAAGIRSGVRVAAVAGQPFSCTPTGFNGWGQPWYSSGTPGMLTGITWSGTGTSGCTIAASISSTISAIDPQGASHVIAAGSCAGCTSSSVVNTGYSCTQGVNGGVNCAGAWQLSYTAIFQVPTGYTFTSASGVCVAAGSVLICTATVPAGVAYLFNSPVLPACPTAVAAVSSVRVLAAASTPACYNLPPNGALPVLWLRNITDIRDSHFPGGVKADPTKKTLFYPKITNTDLQRILEAGLKDPSGWTDSSGGYYEKTFPYAGAGTLLDGSPATRIVIVVAKYPEQAPDGTKMAEVITMYPA